MQKLIGSCLFLMACTGGYFSWYRMRMQRIDKLQELLSFLDYVMDQMQGKRASFLWCVEHYYKATEGMEKLRLFAEELRKRGSADVCETWNTFVKEELEEIFPLCVSEELCALGEGFFVEQTQVGIKRLKVSRVRMQEKLEQEKAILNKKHKVFFPICVLEAMMLVIILL